MLFNEKIYNTLLQRMESAKITQRLQSSKEGTKYTVLDPPRVPLEPFKPNKILVALMGLLCGCGAGVGMVFLSRFAGLLSGLGVIVLMYAISKRRSGDSAGIGCYFSLYLLALSGHFCLWAVGGLETTFYALLVVLGWWFFLNIERNFAMKLLFSLSF